MKKWLDEDDRNLKAWAAEGLSASQIAYKVGNVSRNAVIGRLYRLGVPLSKFAAQRITKDRKRNGKLGSIVAGLRRKQLHGTASASRPTPKRKDKVNALFADDGALQKLAAVPDVARVACLDDLEMHHCKYPIGDCREGPMQFCGDRKIEGLPYCERHVHRCYQPVAPLTRKEPPHVALKVVA